MTDAAPALAVVVPYRDRPGHLAAFELQLRAYFTRDKADRHIPYRVIVVEQAADGLPFNRGMLLNIGFALTAQDCAYVAFHDVDYLPVWTDYSPVDRPTPLVWYGAERRPVAPGRSDIFVAHTLEDFFGGAVLVPSDQVRAVDGYSNGYWGWGWEDTDLRARFMQAGLPLGRRRGTYVALDHDNTGYAIDGAATPISEANAARFAERHAAAVPSPDGLSTLDYRIEARRSLPPSDPNARPAEWEIVTISLRLAPSPAQLAAFTARSEAPNA